MTDEEARDWLVGPDADTGIRTRMRWDVLDAVKEADDTRPIAGIDRPTWGGMTPNDRMHVARFAAMLRVLGPARTEER